MSEIKALYIVNNPITDFIESFNQISKERRDIYIKQAFINDRSLMDAFVKEILAGSKDDVIVEKGK
jgi:hypothetical protein